MTGYDPFGEGPFAVATRTFSAPDPARDRVFPGEIWTPAAGDEGRRASPLPLVIFCHGSGGNRKSAAYLCAHLASHGYLAAAMDHSEVVAAELAPAAEQTAGQRAARIDAVIASRVPDVRFLLGFLLAGGAAEAGPDPGEPDPERIGLVGYSFGGWTALAVPEADDRVRAVVALGPGGSSNPRPGILPLTLTFRWRRDVPVLYLAAEDDVSIPLDGVIEVHDRTPASRRMFVLRRADHQHFLDDVAGQHEALRAMSLPGAAAWIPAAMRPISELCPPEEAHDFVRGLTLAHLDATLRESEAAKRFLAGDVEPSWLAGGLRRSRTRGVD